MRRILVSIVRLKQWATLGFEFCVLCFQYSFSALQLEAIGPSFYSIGCDISGVGWKFDFSCGVLLCAHLLSGLWAESRESCLLRDFGPLVGFCRFRCVWKCYFQSRRLIIFGSPVWKLNRISCRRVRPTASRRSLISR